MFKLVSFLSIIIGYGFYDSTYNQIIINNYIKTKAFLPNKIYTHTSKEDYGFIDSALLKDRILNNNALIIMPENSLEDNIWNGFLKDSKVINTLIKRIQIEKSSGFIFGTVIKSDRRTDKGLNNHFDRNFKISYSEFGSSIFLDSTGNTQVHLKRKLVPKEEYLPSIFKETTLRSSKLTHGFDYNNIRFKNCNLVSLICYESFFGENVAKCVQDSGEAIIMIANQQIFPFNHADEFYTNICKIRAIENSKFFLKVSNMGISCLINPFGDIVKQNDLKKASILSTELPLTKTQTFYTKYAFYIHWIYLLQPLLLIFIISACVKRK